MKVKKKPMTLVQIKKLKISTQIESIDWAVTKLNTASKVAGIKKYRLPDDCPFDSLKCFTSKEIRKIAGVNN